MVPKQRQSRTRGRKRRSQQGLSRFNAVACPNCGSPRRPHAACMECGYVRPGLKINVGKED